MSNRHGTYAYVVDGEIFTHEGRQTEEGDFLFDAKSRELFGPIDPKVTTDTNEHQNCLGPITEYTRIFLDRAQVLNKELIEKLGWVMVPDDEDDVGDPDESGIPSAYTYLGQFIAHDMTFMQRSSSNQPNNYRTPRLDFDSIYAYDKTAVSYPCTDSSGPLPIGCTGNFDLVDFFHEDLPRRPSHEAIVGDPRNDDVLPVAQTHVVMMKFANRVASVATDEGEARELCTKHFQSVVLHDYLRKVCDDDVWNDVEQNWRALVAPRRMSDADRRAFKIPIEFAMAFRFGHSMIRSRYRNWVFDRDADLETFWDETYNSGVDFGVHHQGIGGVWVNNWYRLLDFAGTRYEAAQVADGGAVIHSAAINTYLARQLGRIPEQALPDPICGTKPFTLLPNLAVRTLLMHHALELMDGRAIAEAVHKTLVADKIDRPDFKVLKPDDVLKDEPFVDKLTTEERALIGKHPPLWFYVLKEAQLLGSGLTLGPVGSRIVLETIHAAIEAAETSILHDKWIPDTRLDPGSSDFYTFPRLVAFAGDPAPVK